jgi:acyl carrier protein
MADIDEILDRLFGYLAGVVPPGTELAAETDLVATLRLDSITVINLVVELEDAYDVSVPLNALADVRTAGELARLVHEIVQEG